MVLHIQKGEVEESGEYEFCGYIGELFAFHIFRSYRYENGEEVYTEIGEITSVHGEVKYRTTVNYDTKIEAFMDLMMYVLNYLNKIYAYRNFTNSDFEIIETKFERLVDTKVPT